MHYCVEQVIHEDHADDRACSLLVLRFCIVCTCSCPAGENGCHADESYQVLGAAVELLCEEGGRHAGDEVPAGQSEVNLVLLAAICNSDGG